MLGGINPLMMAQSGGLRPQDVFAANVFSGNGGTQTITTGIDLATFGGMLWGKDRINPTDHAIVDTVRGVTSGRLASNLTSATAPASDIASVSTTGVTLGVVWSGLNNSGRSPVLWSFRRAAKFFDVVTWTGNGVAGRQIAHALSVAPGMIIVKNLGNAAAWAVYHRNLGATQGLSLNAADAAATVSYWNSTDPTATYFTLTGGGNVVNASGQTYVAYLFAHDTDASGIVQCGTYVGTSASNSISLPWRPQFLMVKCISLNYDWYVWDAARSTANPRDTILRPNSSGAEQGPGYVLNWDFNASGFSTTSAYNEINGSGQSYVYLAIREPIL